MVLGTGGIVETMELVLVKNMKHIVGKYQGMPYINWNSRSGLEINSSFWIIIDIIRDDVIKNKINKLGQRLSQTIAFQAA